MGTAYLRGLLYIPLSDVNLNKIKRDLTVPYSSYENNKFVTKKLKCYKILKKKCYIGVPRAYGIKNFSHLRIKDKTVNDSRDKAFDVCNIVPRDKEQKKFIDAIYKYCTDNDYMVHDYLANAKTGSGKTVSDLFITAKLGKPTLVIVPTNSLKEQWLGSKALKQGIVEFFGKDFVDNYVGVVQQDICDYKGKLIVVGSLSSLALRNYDKEFYEYFSKITIDEVHKCGAPKLSRVLGLFSANIRGGYTATNRDDALQKVLELHLGKPKIKSKQEVLKPIVHIYPYSAQHKFYNNSFNTIKSRIGYINDRNRVLTEIIYNRGYKRDRNCVVLSDSVKQLQKLHDLLLKKGVAAGSVGLYVGQLYEKNSKGGFTNNKKSVIKTELSRIANDCKIILATYKIFGTGVDISRLDFGVEASPISNVTQALGRVLRLKEGKPQPEWVTILDDIYYTDVYFDEDSNNRQVVRKEYSFFRNAYKKRLECYEQQNATIKKVKGIYNVG